MSDLGPLNYYLGIEVHQNKGMITLSQGAYATSVVEKLGLTWLSVLVPRATGFLYQLLAQSALPSSPGSA
jgi:hypothetical protein